MGLNAALDAALDRLASPETDGYFIHLDADVLDDAVMPAVDYRIEDGLSVGDLERVLKRALATGGPSAWRWRSTIPPRTKTEPRDGAWRGFSRTSSAPVPD